MYCTVTQWKRLPFTKNFNIDDDNINSDKHVENKERERERERLETEPEKIEHCNEIVIFREQGQQFLPFSVCQSELCKRPHFLKWPQFKKSS